MKTFIKLVAMSCLLTCGALMISLTGCATNGSQSQTKQAAIAEIDIFRNGTLPTREYRELGRMVDDGKEIEQPKIEEKMIIKAKKMGGQGIIFEKPSFSGTETSVKVFSFGAFGDQKATYLYKAIVIAYK